MGKTPLASKMVLDAWQAHIMPPALNMQFFQYASPGACMMMISEAAKATMEAWLDHMNEKVQLRKELVTEDVHLMVPSQHLDRATTHDGIDNAPLSTQSASNRGAYRQCNTSAEKVKALDMGAVVVVLVQRDGYSHTKAAELAEEYVFPANI
eukprot:s1744_g9.t1